jgi:quercetin dioxygenase-like cupin family protein
LKITYFYTKMPRYPNRQATQEGSIWWSRNMEQELTSMKQEHTELQAQMRADESPARPSGSGVATIVSQEKLADVPGKTLTVQVVDVPPGGRVPEHHHGGPTIDYVLSGTVRMQLLGGPALVYQPGQTLFEPRGSVHLYAENLSLIEPAKIMLIHVADDGAQLVVFH